MLRNQLHKSFTTPRTNPAKNWRAQINQNQVVSQASTILLQRHTKFWSQLLKPLKLSSSLTPSLFHQILTKIQTQPKICFAFLNWAQKALNFKPDLRVQCRVARVLYVSGQAELGMPVLDSIVRECPPAKIVPLLIGPQKDSIFFDGSLVLSGVIECYCGRGMYLECLEVYQKGVEYRVGLSVEACNKLLSLLGDENELRLAWCCYGSFVRNGVEGDSRTWSAVARILYKDGKFDRIASVLDRGIFTPEMFDLMIDGYSERGDFEAAFVYLDEMCGKGIEPSFSTYGSMLDGACKHQNTEVIENVVSFMVEKGHIFGPLATDYDLIIRKLCDLRKTYAMDIFYKRACDKKIELQNATYEFMLRALLSNKDRVKDAIDLYNSLRQKNILLSESCCNEFIIVLCKENPSHEVSNLLVDIVRLGFTSEAKEFSKYISKQCAEGRWREAEKLFNLILSQGSLLDSLPCGAFVKRYCYGKKIDQAIMVHDKLEELRGSLDTATYTIFLATLFKEKRIEYAIKVFDYMRTCGKINSESFSLMIRGLCHEKELRKAMALHDEMLELGLKPDKRAYKKLISGFG